MKLPVQPTFIDEHETRRFRPNKLVRHLLDNGGIDMNDLAMLQDRVPREDYVQFAQLIGYSVSGFGDLSYVTDEDWEMVPDSESL